MLSFFVSVYPGLNVYLRPRAVLLPVFTLGLIRIYVRIKFVVGGPFVSCLYTFDLSCFIFVGFTMVYRAFT